MKNNNTNITFLISGVVNTIFGYFCGLIIYELFYKKIGLITVSVITNIISISFAFCSYKIFVFKTKGNWIKEYLKCYLVYGVSALISILVLWVLVELIALPFWLAQGLSIAIIVVFSFLGHRKFTFYDPGKDKIND